MNDEKDDLAENEPIENNTNEVTALEKWLIAAILGVVFLIIASPLVFKFTNSIFGYIGWHTIQPGTSQKPTLFGWILHAIVFIIIVRILMR